MPVSNPILLNNFRRSIDVNENYLLNESKKKIDYSYSKNKILVGLKTNLLSDMKDRYKYDEDGDKIHFFNDKGEHFGTLFDKGSRYQELRHNGKLNDLGWLKESEMNEATTSWSKMMKGVNSGGVGPWSLIATEYKKVVGQEINIKIKDSLPANFEEMRRKYPRASIHIEDSTGSVVWQDK